MSRTAKTIERYDSIADDYSIKVEKSTPRKELLKFISKLSRNAFVLDVGCAAGRDTILLKNAGLKVIGIDLSKELLRIAKEKYPEIEFQLKDMRDTGFDHNKFDGLWVCGVLHELNIQDIPNAIKEFYRILNNDGILFIRTKYGESTKQVNKDVYSSIEREVTFLDSKELERLLSDMGFEKIETYVQQSPSRKDVKWICTFHKKVAK